MQGVLVLLNFLLLFAFFCGFFYTYISFFKTDCRPIHFFWKSLTVLACKFSAFKQGGKPNHFTWYHNCTTDFSLSFIIGSVSSCVPGSNTASLTWQLSHQQSQTPAYPLGLGFVRMACKAEHASLPLNRQKQDITWCQGFAGCNQFWSGCSAKCKLMQYHSNNKQNQRVKVQLLRGKQLQQEMHVQPSTSMLYYDKAETKWINHKTLLLARRNCLFDILYQRKLECK